MQKYVFVKLLEEPPKSGVFDMKNWPLHVTIVPRFSCSGDISELTSLAEQTVQDLDPVSTTVSEEALFGPEENIPVSLLMMTDELRAMHQLLYDKLVEHGAVFDEPQYCGAGFQAHATVQESGKLNKGDNVIINELSLIDMFPGQDITQRKALDTITLNS